MKKKAIVLLSGGLDSILAAQILHAQRIEVLALYFMTPFNYSAVNANPQASIAARAAKSLGIAFKSCYLFDSYIEMLRKPKYGFGKNINPCLDCHILMLKEAKKVMEEIGASFITTGEVLGQRSMSQRRDTLNIVERDSGLRGLLLRPLCARLLPETLPEQEGIVEREKLLDISGRGRKRQLALAEKWGITKYSSPAGGCLLTDKSFARRVEDLLKFQDSIGKNDAELLKLGRHFRINSRLKLIVGRNDKENKEIFKLALPGEALYQPPKGFPGPLALSKGAHNGSYAPLVGGILLRYCSKKGDRPKKIIFRMLGKDTIYPLSPPILSEEEIERMRI